MPIIGFVYGHGTSNRVNSSNSSYESNKYASCIVYQSLVSKPAGGLTTSVAGLAHG